MPLCSKCQHIDLDQLHTDAGFQLHSDWTSFELNAQSCGFCSTIRTKILESYIREYHFHLDTRLSEVVRPEDYALVKAKHKDDPFAVIRWPKDRDTSIWIRLIAYDARPGLRLNEGKAGFDFWMGSRRSQMYRSTWEWNGMDIEPGDIGKTGISSFVYPGIVIEFMLRVTTADRCEGDPLRDKFIVEVRKPVAPTSFHEDAMSWAEALLQGCKSSHAACQQSYTYPPPKRLLNLSRVRANGRVDIIEVGTGPCPKYVTLSYCWGTPADEVWMAYLKDVQTNSFVFDFNRMPTTLKDATTVALRLGYDYLWIDALCILQHDLDDWHEEGARMSDIYEGCELMICASSCDHTSKGFLNQRLNPEDCIVEVPLRINNSSTGILHFETRDVDYIADTVKGPVASRAWCLQEQRLAPRVLHFGKYQLHYECNAGKWREDEPELDLAPRTTFYASEHSVREPQVRDLFHRELSASKPMASVSTVSQWNAILADYTMRRLTHGSDKLVALSGLANKASELLKCEYLAGTWQVDLHMGLCWYVAPLYGLMHSGNQMTAFNPLFQGTSRRALEYRAPSWSWASMDGPIEFLMESDPGVAELTTSSVEYVDASVQLTTANKFGAVEAAQLTLKAPLKVISSDVLAANAVVRHHRYFNKDTSKIGWYVEDEQKTLEGDLTCMKLATLSYGIGPGMTPENIILILEQTHDGCYRRVGAGTVLVTEYFDDAPVHTITLV
ncbi:hypothetical protein H2198_004175 [Neophaeococcomyces mojaviensis]|uniref:Uncharacterized protein n=1 Tax=Neophaeococcomyces mojaviensis TaxID=3383035 RepID=A0ACC3A9A2_9EURO|nr:hypothetical protein H2198_004175 [Knufia sp. JES_112]